MFVTEVETVTNTDTKFPDFSLEEWELIEKEDFKKDDDNEFNYSFLHYKRKEGK